MPLPIQSVVRSTFFDFLVYMFASLNERNDVHILVEEPQCCPPVHQLFLDLLSALPAPELARIKMLMAANQRVSPLKSGGHFVWREFRAFRGETL